MDLPDLDSVLMITFNLSSQYISYRWDLYATNLTVFKTEQILRRERYVAHNKESSNEKNYDRNIIEIISSVQIILFQLIFLPFSLTKIGHNSGRMSNR